MAKNNVGENNTRKGSLSVKTGKKVIKQLVTRGFTILVLAPSVFYLISVSRMAMVAIVYIVICFCSFEWSGVKRHLKVAVLLAKNHSHHTSVDGLEFSDGGGEIAPPPAHSEDEACIWRPLATEHRLEENVLKDAPLWVSETAKAENDQLKVPHTPILWPTEVVPLVSRTEGGEGEVPKGWAESAVGLEDTPFLNASVKEFAFPVPTLTTYNVCKHLSWANLAIAASHGSLPFLLLFSAYFLMFVGVTIIAHNRLEFRVEEAMGRLLEMRAMSTLRSSASELISGRGSFLSRASSSSGVLSPVLETREQNDGKKDTPFLEAKADSLEPTERHDSRSGSGKEDAAMCERKNERGNLPSARFWTEEEDHTASTMRHRGEAENRRGHHDHRSNTMAERATIPRLEEKEEGERGAASAPNSPHAMRYMPSIPDACKSVSLPLPPSLFPSFSLSGFFSRERDLQEKARKEQARFARLELSVIVENQPAEQFVDFCLDIFGCVWISLFATVIMVYDIPFLGFPWVCAALAGNFSNDIMALVVGMTVKTIKGRFFSHLKNVQGHESRGRRGSLSARRRENSNAARNGKPRLGRFREEGRSEKPDPRKTNGTSLRMGGREKEKDSVQPEEKAREGHSAEGKDHSLSTTTTTTKVPLEPSLPPTTRRSWWSDVEDFMAGAPHPLYLSISPNKSVEGALAGVLTNTIVFVLVLSLWPWGDTAYSSVDHSYYYRYDTTNLPKTAPSGMETFTGLRGSTDFAFPCPRPLQGAEDWPLPASCVRVPRYHCFCAWVVAGFIMGVAGVVGDLLQSLLKRVSRVKDTGSLLPGHGGMLDRVDGLLVSFPTLFFLVYVVIALG